MSAYFILHIVKVNKTKKTEKANEVEGLKSSWFSVLVVLFFQETSQISVEV